MSVTVLLFCMKACSVFQHVPSDLWDVENHSHGYSTLTHVLMKGTDDCVCVCVYKEMAIM